jgi:hypothetical protein
MTRRRRPFAVAGTALALALAAGAFAGLALRSGAVARQPDPLAEPFRGITTDGTPVEGLFPIRATGVSTEPIRRAADAFLAVLTDEQRARATFPVDHIKWRRWSNVSRFDRDGVSFEEMTDAQREAGIGMARAGLSARGLEKVRNVMRLDGHLADLLNNYEVYGEHKYYLSVLGRPSATEPWGWQLEGHHLLVTYFVLGDQVVMTPTFLGSEPVAASSGRFAGIAVLQEEQDKGLAFMQSLDAGQQATATLATSKAGNNALAQAFRDNLILDYAGVRGDALSPAQRAQLLDLIGEYVNNMRDGHARVRMEEVAGHLDATYFAWIGEIGPDATFYYRIHSPVILIEFDHQLPAALPGPRVPTRAHIHSVVRTPNGGDYGKDLLRQHYERHRHDAAHGHTH